MSLPQGYRTTFGVEAPDTRTNGKAARRAIAIAASQIRREQVEWLESGRIPLRMVTVLAGIGGLGKSQLACLYAAANPDVTLIATAEDSPSTTVRPRLEAVEADLSRVRFVSIKTAEGFEEGIAIPDDMEELDRLVAEVEARLVIVDPLVAHLPASIDAHKDQSVRGALAPLYRLAEARNCAVLALLHLNKAQGLAPLMRLGGSGAFGNAARSVLLLDRDPDDPDGEEGNRRVLAHIKCNVAPLAPSLVYQVKPIVLPAVDENPEVETSRLELIGESPHNGRALLATASDEERTALDEAQEFLAAELDDGARHRAADIFKAARQLGISDRTLKRARKRLGVETEKAGFEAGWEWWLPKVPSTVAPLQPAEVGLFAETRMDNQMEASNAAEGVSHGALAPSGVLAPSPLPGDNGFLDRIATGHRDGWITTGEALEREQTHALVLRAGTA